MENNVNTTANGTENTNHITEMMDALKTTIQKKDEYINSITQDAIADRQKYQEREVELRRDIDRYMKIEDTFVTNVLQMVDALAYCKKNHINDIIELLSSDTRFIGRLVDVFYANNKLRELYDAIKEHSDYDEININTISEYIDNNCNDAQTILEYVMPHIDCETVAENMYEQLSSREQRDFLSNKLQELSDDDFRTVVTNA